MDGFLTDGQIRMYVEVRERQAKILRVAAGAGGGGAGSAGIDDLAVADLRAAQELRANPREYSWVKNQVSAARAAEAARALDERVKAGFAPTLARLEDEEARVTDPVRKREMANEVAALRVRLRRAVPPLAPAVVANLERLAPFRDRLEAADRETSGALADAVAHRVALPPRPRPTAGASR